MKALDNHQVIYCNWKSNEHLDDALEGNTDLDILFDPSQRVKIESIFCECELKRFRSTPHMQYNAIEDYIGFDQETAKIWHVHTHYRLTLGEKHLKGYTITHWGTILLNNRTREAPNVWISNSSDEYILLLCRIALKLRWRDYFRKLGKNDCQELEWLGNRISKETLGLAADLMVDERTKRIIFDLYERKPAKKAQYVSLQKVLRKNLKSFTFHNTFSSWFIRTKREISWLIGGTRRRLGISDGAADRRISPAGGLVVAIVGCDGTGKTTTFSYAYNEFKKKIDVLPIYFGSGDGDSSLLRRPMKCIAQRVGGRGIGRKIEKQYAEKKITIKARIYSLAKILWAVVLAREKKRKQHYMLKARNNGLLVLTDRYPQCIFPGASDGPLLNRYRESKGMMKIIANWEQKVYENFSKNPPDLIIKLDVPTEIAISRKPEMSVEEIENKKRVVNSLNTAEHIICIDTSQPFSVTYSEVMKEIWKLI